MHLFHQAPHTASSCRCLGMDRSALHSPPVLASHGRGKAIIQEPELESSSTSSACALAAEEKHPSGGQVTCQGPRTKATVNHQVDQHGLSSKGEEESQFRKAPSSLGSQPGAEPRGGPKVGTHPNQTLKHTMESGLRKRGQALPSRFISGLRAASSESELATD